MLTLPHNTTATIASHDSIVRNTTGKELHLVMHSSIEPPCSARSSSAMASCSREDTKSTVPRPVGCRQTHGGSGCAHEKYQGNEQYAHMMYGWHDKYVFPKHDVDIPFARERRLTRAKEMAVLKIARVLNVVPNLVCGYSRMSAVHPNGLPVRFTTTT